MVPWSLPDVDSLLAARGGGDLPTHGYFLGGELIRWLLKSRGPQPIKDFMESVYWGDSPDKLRTIYTEHFGSSIDDDLFASINWGSEGYSPAELGCRGEHPSIDAEGRIHHLQATLDCSSPRVRSQFQDRDSEGLGYVEWLLEVEGNDDGLERFEVAGEIPAGTELSYARCDCRTTMPEEQGPHFLDPTDARPVGSGGRMYLRPGSYRVLWSGPLDAGHSLDVRLVGPCDFDKQDCPSGEQCTLWSECIPEIPEPAQSGEPCVQIDHEPAVCVAGSVCLGGEGGGQVEGWCTPQCESGSDCSSGQACSVWGFCGVPCDVLAQDCADGYGCHPPLAEGVPVCLPSGQVELLESCGLVSCAPGLLCEPVEQLPGCAAGLFGGCCTQICELGQSDQCPPELPNCEPEFYGLGEAQGVGVCLP
ncbi:hypothetical protein DB30_05769 [Enhygromyxa salina]|uniref:Uncharacterized protein n=1 Tax=Enhygromyxa salina TaxID=215803 RepID=A0A0C2D072_9BACT|nr:hypothetical protein DB30_05769 [Enhygromyxa salina]